MNVLLIGIGGTTYSALQSLIAVCNVCAIVRPIDSPDDPVAELARQQEIPIFADPAQAQIKSLVLKFQPDCVVVSSYNQILPADIIELSAFINVHYSPLPRYRGRANVNWAMLNNEPVAAISIHRIEPGLDEGNILFQKLIPIGERETIGNLYDRLNDLQRQHLGQTVVNAGDGDVGIPQNHDEATYGCTRLPEDGEINWSDDTATIDRTIRALGSPFPGAHTFFKCQKIIVWQAEPIHNPPVYAGRVPGRTIGRSKAGGYVDVLTGDGVLRILQLQLPGGEITAAANVIKSVKITLGLCTADLLDRIQTLEAEIIKLKQYEK